MQEQSLYNPNNIDHLKNPYPDYQRLLHEAPLYRLPKGVLKTPAQNEWLASSYEYATFILKDPRFIREGHRLHPPKEGDAPRPEFMQKYMAALGGMLMFRDPPTHTRLRGLINKAFTPVNVEALRPQIIDTTQHLLKQTLELGEFDLIREFALPLPVIVIGEMLGVPVEDRDLFKTWSISISRTVDGTQSDPAVFISAANAFKEMGEYIKDIVRKRQTDTRDDILTSLIRAEEDGDRLNEQELISTCIMLLVAGHETFTNFVGNGFWTLSQHPEALQAIRENPDLAKGAVEEILRYESPVQRTLRFAESSVVIGDQEIQRGDAVSVVLGAANRDPKVFQNPDAFDITRQPNRHLAFSTGIHFCIGASLARLEGEIAIHNLVINDMKLTVTNDTPNWKMVSSFRGLDNLPVRWV